MGAVPTLPSWSTNVKIPGASLQQMSDAITWDFATRPIAHLIQTTAQTGWTSGVFTAVTFTLAGSEVVDRDGQHDPATNPSRVLIGNTLGLYRISGVYTAAVNTNITRIQGEIALNGTVVTGSYVSVGITGNFTHSIATGTVYVRSTVATDYIELWGAETVSAGTPIGTAVGGGAACSLAVELVGS